MKPKSKDDSGQPRPSEAEAIEATAAAWLAQRDDALTADEAREFARWRAADPRHEEAVARLEGAWAALRPLRDFRPEARRHPDRDLLARPARGRVVAFPVRAVALAAAAAIALALGWWALRPSSPSTVHYATTVGGYERVMLTDGSVLELNGDTSAEVRFSTAERRVTLARGEAHFTVAKNPVRPFWVEAGGVTVRAVGTAFNVRVGTREVEVLVTEGKVSLSEATRSAPAATTAPENTTAATPAAEGVTFLEANQRATVSTSRIAAATPAPPPAAVVERVAPEVVREALAWQAPRLVFADTPLSEVVAQFNRRNTVQLVLADAALNALPVGGSFRAENVEAFVRLMESGGDVKADRTEAGKIVLRSTR